MSFTYLASPYSHPEKLIRDKRYNAVMDTTVWLLSQRVWVYSPIVHCHELVKRYYSLRTDAEFWKDFNEAMLDKADRLLILTLPGWEDSKGIQLEVTFFWQRPFPIHFISPKTHHIEENSEWLKSLNLP